MPNVPGFPLRIFYDGSCSVCAREIEFYRRRDREHQLVCLDISAPDFAAEQYNIALEDFMHQLHAIDQRGTVYKGVDAFWAIWQAFPTSTVYGLMGTVIQLPGIHAIAGLCYKGFARIRPFLPKNRRDCQTGTCRIGKRQENRIS